MIHLARVLDIPSSLLNQIPAGQAVNQTPSRQGVLVDQAVLDRFHQLGPYLEMLNRAVLIKDEVLIEHIAGKLAGAFTLSSHLRAINN